MLARSGAPAYQSDSTAVLHCAGRKPVRNIGKTRCTFSDQFPNARPYKPSCHVSCITRSILAFSGRHSQQEWVDSGGPITLG